MTRRLPAITTIALTAGALGLGLFAATPRGGQNVAYAQDQGGPAVGAKAPAFTVKTLKGKTLDPTKQRGKVVLVDFWATWCGPCKEAIPAIQAIQTKYRSRGLIALGVSNETRKVVAPFAAQNKMTYSLAADPAYSAAMQKYNVSGIPTMVLIDKKGIIRMVQVGFGEGVDAKVEQMVKKLLAEKG